jgi:glutathione synthase/RimK-type ligase-like ATP-grasp enzyme
VLIVSTQADLHADVVGAKVADLGGRPFRLNLDEFPGHYDVTLGFDGRSWSGELVHRPSGQALAVRDVGAVWMRKRAPFHYGPEALAPQERAYADGEMEHVLLGLLQALDCYWMSHPRALRAAGWKGEQMARAARMGFRTPPSLVTNRRQALAAFRDAAEDGVVFKSLASADLAADQVAADARIAAGVPTTRIAEEHEGLLDAIEALPTFFQDHVAKAYELRVTVIGELVFAARIDSQADPRTAVDCRDMSAPIRYEPARLPEDVERRCLDFVHSYDLTFGAIDLIVTPAGEYVFLENNPGGQFLFIEQLVPELPLSSAVAGLLATRAESPR